MTQYIKITILLFLLVLGGGVVSAQSVVDNKQFVKVTGKVLDENNEPLSGASVVQLSNPKNGAATYYDGHFTLNVPADSKIKVTYAGYEDTVVVVNDSVVLTEIVVRLKPSKSGWIYLSMNPNPMDGSHMNAVNIYSTAMLLPPKEQ